MFTFSEYKLIGIEYYNLKEFFLPWWLQLKAHRGIRQERWARIGSMVALFFQRKMRPQRHCPLSQR